MNINRRKRIKKKFPHPAIWMKVETEISPPRNRKHYVICQHGLFGSGNDFRFVQEHLNNSGRNMEVILLKASSFPPKTLDGVIPGGTRCYDEIMSWIHAGRVMPDSDISFIGHSLGGIYIRYALRLIEQKTPTLWSEHSLARKYVIFVASPHCGIHSASWWVRQSSKYLFKHAFATVKDLLLETPILLDLCDPAGLQSLNAFQRVVLYGNIARDHTVTAMNALILPAAIPVQEHQDASVMKITEYVIQHEDTENASDSDVLKLVNRFNAGIKNLTRYVVNSPPSSRIPSLFSSFDNTAHARILCHGILDRARVGQPMLEHLESILLS